MKRGALEKKKRIKTSSQVCLIEMSKFETVEVHKVYTNCCYEHSKPAAVQQFLDGKKKKILVLMNTNQQKK